MIVYKFGGATTRTAKGLETLVDLVRAAHLSEIQEARKRRRPKPGANELHGIVLVVSAIGHATRSLGRAGEQAKSGELSNANESLMRVVHQHEQLAQALRLLTPSRERFSRSMTETYTVAKEMLEGIAITRELTLRTRDALLAIGETMALDLIETLLVERGLPVQLVDARRVIVTNETFGSAEPLLEEITACSKQHIKPLLERSQIVLTQGFVGQTRDGRTTTMGSESSDLTATLLASALGAEEVVIWKSVPGIFTADPELVPGAKLIKELTFAEAEELGRRGARVLHPRIAHPLRERSWVKLRVASPKSASTRMTSIQETRKTRRTSVRPLAVSAEQNLMSITTSNVARVSRKQSGRSVSTPKYVALHTVSTSESTTYFIRRDDRSKLNASIDREIRSADKELLAAISLTVQSPDPSVDFNSARGDFHKALRAFNPSMMLTAEKSLVAFVPQEKALAALRKVHKEFFGV